ncbi:aldo/keto reductase [candidate division KSB1 bacterium]|nr:aldo/keto reductase [candidate division KSB1 bacterium]
MDRRDFIKTSFTGGAVISLSTLLNCSQSEKNSPFPKRELGKTGEMLSMIGFGGILVSDEEQANANNAVAKAFDRGINYFDVAPTYGNAEDKLGPALKPYRDRSFLACKTEERTKEGAEKELNESLKKLNTDHFDLYQLHAITTIEDVETAFGPDGAMETFVRAKKEGKTRYLGFSAHSEEAALLAMQKYDFDTILFPINFAAWLQGNFGPRVVEKAKEKNMGILALKGLAHSRRAEGEERKYKKCWYNPIAPEDDELADMALRFTFAQGVTAAIPPGEPLFFPRALEIAANVTPVTREEEEKLLELSKGLEPIFKTA